MIGRPPKPTRLKQMQGNPGKRPLNKLEPKAGNEMPTCPRHLAKEAKAEWRRMGKELHRLGLLARCDRAALATYCVAWEIWVKAYKKLNDEEMVVESDKGNLYQNPWVGIERQARKDMLRIMTEFGMTPSARSRIRLEPVARQLSLVDELFKVVQEV